MKNMIDIFKYFGNKDFEEANADREFTIDEMLCIMMFSEEVSIEERARDMKVLAEYTDGDKRAKIERCIESELKKLDIIKNMKRDDVSFLSYGNDIMGKHINRYKTFDEAIASGVDNELVFINEYYDTERRSSSISNFTVKDGNVTDIFLVSEVDYDKEARGFTMTEVKLNSPFKPFDIVEVGGKHYIVADLDSKCTKTERENIGRIITTIPVYRRAKDGDITIDIIRQFPWRISELQKLNARDMTLSNIEEIEYIKEHLA